jgi:hypothetical protein
MPDIIVTTPQSQSINARQEAEDAKQWGADALYYRRLGGVSLPSPVKSGDRIYYVDCGQVTGYLVVDRIEKRSTRFQCLTTGNTWDPGLYAVMRADSWQWIKPIPMRGFQGYRYTSEQGKVGGRPVEVVGNWRDPRPQS